jgi:WhiB family redox-sensing transcriptional regulator
MGWQEQGLCAQVDGDLWYPDKGESNQAAKRICGRCPVQPQCLGYALANHEWYGVWGGLSYQERLRLTRQAAA